MIDMDQMRRDLAAVKESLARTERLQDEAAGIWQRSAEAERQEAYRRGGICSAPPPPPEDEAKKHVAREARRYMRDPHLYADDPEAARAAVEKRYRGKPQPRNASRATNFSETTRRLLGDAALYARNPARARAAIERELGIQGRT